MQELVSSSCPQHLPDRIVIILLSEELVPDDNSGRHVKIWTGDVYGTQRNRAHMFVKNVLS